ncbi:unnamed protein product [Gongylonema pulchrum]|uniref:Uncharacterized protein n=1 Tax=Gongylonema pulchrum TaxID=637853 RepID=A0A183DKC0_9BILA|nr:unnamed protein product [Gongylonema pulchrum]
MPAGAADEAKKARMASHAEEWCPLASRKVLEERRAKRRRLDMLGGEELHYVPCMRWLVDQGGGEGCSGVEWNR